MDIKKMIKIYLVIFWFSCGVLASGALNAYYKAQPMYNGRDDTAVAYGFGLVGGPLMLVVSPFVTGSFENGFQFDWK